MAEELEAKVQVPALSPVRAALSAAGATRRGASHQLNRFFDTADGALRRRGCGLRIRTADNGASIAFKGPFQPGPFKRREEFETEVADAAAAEAILRGLGLEAVFEFGKHRESWSLDGCFVELDSVPELGEFVEVEGPDEPAIRAVLARLGLDRLPVIRAGYVELLLKARSGRS
jgi:predicted adenylyl cyclase CyaB